MELINTKYKALDLSGGTMEAYLTARLCLHSTIVGVIITNTKPKLTVPKYYLISSVRCFNSRCDLKPKLYKHFEVFK